MISVVILTLNDAQRLTATLAALAPAAMDGFVREVIVADGGSTDGTLEVAEDAGAALMTIGFAEALAAARQPWLLILAPGTRPQVGWEKAAHAHMRDYPGRAGWFDLAFAEPDLASRLREAMAGLESGLLARPRRGAGPVDFEAVAERSRRRSRPMHEIVRKLGRGRMRRLGVRALMGKG